uniref:Uncharacterized protein n=1 Tax=Branchiostoma floridae TaxID=7739 RepID=C3YB71_BRAFL|eukprot:XP_002606523.1 hypothetical protein BRAFLDRAFT_91893 [Branchiostoma floridae]
MDADCWPGADSKPIRHPSKTSDIVIPDWELQYPFDPLGAAKKRISSVHWRGASPAPVGPVPSVEDVACKGLWASPQQLKFPDPETFMAENIHNHCDYWQELARKVGVENGEVIRWASEGVDLEEYFRPFKGQRTIKRICLLESYALKTPCSLQRLGLK